MVLGGVRGRESALILCRSGRLEVEDHTGRLSSRHRVKPRVRQQLSTVQPKGAAG